MCFDEMFRSYGLVSISRIDPSIRLQLKYATEDNFMGVNLYGSLTKAYFVPEIAERLSCAQKSLKGEFPEMSFLIYDAARPMSIQRRMFEKVRGTDKEIYVASPHDGGGYHNYGLAVDLTIVDGDGVPLDMGTSFDSFDVASHVGDEDNLVQAGIITSQARDNRRLLVRHMSAAGFDQNPTEWWHFQRYSKDEMMKNFSLLDF